MKIARRLTPISTAPRPVTASGSATPPDARDRTDFARYGEEVVFGGGKVIRDGQGQSQTTRAAGAPDLVITNAIILDHWGIVKADIGVRDGRIPPSARRAIRTSRTAMTPGLEIGPSTEVIAGEHRIVTAGGIDTHIHFISPQQAWEALYSGVTTMIGGGTGPADGTRATTARRANGTCTGCSRPSMACR